jgi:hypothetical protein
VFCLYLITPFFWKCDLAGAKNFCGSYNCHAAFYVIYVIIIHYINLDCKYRKKACFFGCGPQYAAWPTNTYGDAPLPAIVILKEVSAASPPPSSKKTSGPALGLLSSAIAAVRSLLRF